MITILSWPAEPVEPVEIGKTSDFIFSGKRAKRAQPAQPKSCEHFKADHNEAIDC